MSQRLGRITDSLSLLYVSLLIVSQKMVQNKGMEGLKLHTQMNSIEKKVKIFVILVHHFSK